MQKRSFLRSLSLLAGGAVLSPFAACHSPRNMEEPLKNWAGNLTYGTSSVYRPQSPEDVQEAVRSCRKMRSLGSRHSFNAIADSDANLVSMSAMNRPLAFDVENMTVDVEGGIRYGDLCQNLDEEGFALHNLASLPHISIAGACATATHGSGVDNANLGAQLAGMAFVDAAGELRTLSREENGETFQGAVVHLGALGPITRLTLALQPSFRMQQAVYLDLPMAVLEDHFEEIMRSGYSVSFFTDWRNGTVNQVWVKRRMGDDEPGSGEDGEYRFDEAFFGARLATKNMHPVATESAVNCTEQMGVPGPWYERLPHFKMGFKPSAGEELQSEYFVPFEHAYEAMRAMESLSGQISPHLFISEIRCIAADDFWMSPCYRQPGVALHTTWKQDWPTVQRLLPLIEEKLSPFNVKPHWGKLFTLDPRTLRSRYSRLEDFRSLVREYDPDGKFRNAFLERNLG